MERLRYMKEALICAAESQMSHLDQVDAKELGEVIDMIKDIEEAIYYCTITEAMEGKDYQGKWNYDRDMDKHEGKMYYSEGSHRPQSGNQNSHVNHPTGGIRDPYQKDDSMEPYDHREGKSAKNRRMYMEAKETHQDKVTQMRELEKYMQELSQDIVEMISDASAEEKQYLEKKLTTLATKVQQMK